MSYFEKDTVISGLGISRIGRRTGIPGLELTMEAVREAITDAGLTPDDIDGISTFGDTLPSEVVDALGNHATDVGVGFGTGGVLTPVMSAFVAVAEKRARHVLVYRTVQMLGGSMTGSTASPLLNPLANPPVEPRTPGTRRKLKPFEDIDALMAAHSYSAANWVAMHCRRHMDLYGTTKEQLGWHAINSRRNAALNPRAAFREPLTMDDYLSARPISTPFGLLDCDIPIDGSIALVVSHADYAADCPNPAVKVEAVGGAYGSGGWFHRDDFPKMASSEAAAEMWSRTDLAPSDVECRRNLRRLHVSHVRVVGGIGFLRRRRSRAFRRGGDADRARRRTAAEHLRGATVRGSHARLLAAARGVPAIARAGR